MGYVCLMEASKRFVMILHLFMYLTNIGAPEKGAALLRVHVPYCFDIHKIIERLYGYYVS